MPRLLRDITAMHAALVERRRAPCDDVLFELTDMVASRAGPITTASAKVLTATKALTRDVAGLLRSWSRSRERVLELAAKPEWAAGWLGGGVPALAEQPQPGTAACHHD